MNMDKSPIVIKLALLIYNLHGLIQGMTVITFISELLRSYFLGVHSTDDSSQRVPLC